MRWEKEVQAAVNQARPLYGVSIDPALVHAIIERETLHGRLPITGTKEPRGRMSYGPMQVLASTARAHGIADPTTLAIPSLGIRIGTFELAKLLNRFGRDTAAAIAGYNAGPGNAHRNAAGRFPNQPYVDAVLGFWKRFLGSPAGAATGGLAVALALGLVLWMTMGRGRRPAWR